MYDSQKAAGDFSHAAGRFESAGFLDKKLIIYADEFLGQKQRELSPQITSVIKKATSNELKRVEKKIRKYYHRSFHGHDSDFYESQIRSSFNR